MPNTVNTLDPEYLKRTAKEAAELRQRAASLSVQVTLISTRLDTLASRSWELRRKSQLAIQRYSLVRRCNNVEWSEK